MDYYMIFLTLLSKSEPSFLSHIEFTADLYTQSNVEIIFTTTNSSDLGLKDQGWEWFLIVSRRYFEILVLTVAVQRHTKGRTLSLV